MQYLLVCLTVNYSITQSAVANDFCFCKTKRKKKRSKSYFHLIMPCTNWLAPTSKSGTAGSWVVSAGGRVVREAGLEESTVGGESV